MIARVTLCMPPHAVNADRSAPLKAGTSTQERMEIPLGDSAKQPARFNSTDSLAISPAAMNIKDKPQGLSLLVSSSDVAGADSAVDMSASSSDMSLATVSSTSDMSLESISSGVTVTAHRASDRRSDLIDRQHLQSSTSSSVTHGSYSLPSSQLRNTDSRAFDQAPDWALWYGREDCRTSGYGGDGSQLSKVRPLERSSRRPQSHDSSPASFCGDYSSYRGSSTSRSRHLSSHSKENRASVHTRQSARAPLHLRPDGDSRERRTNPLRQN